MGIAATLPNFKAFSFGGTSSRTYGVYITGQGVFNAPEKAVEMIEIPGRDGAYALDKGNFSNIEVTYTAGIVADTESDFATAVSDLRNFLCSKSGYQRLEDEYNPNEYRMAVYKSGLEVTHEGLLTGEFPITFNCKPQRFLTSGETVTTLVSGNSITNPTLFPSRPQLQTYGYGNIDIGGEVVSVANVPIGEVQIGASNFINPTSNPQTLDVANLNTGDSFVVSGAYVKLTYNASSGTFATTSAVSSPTGCTATISLSNPHKSLEFTLYPTDQTFAKGTSATKNFSASGTVVFTGGSSNSVTISGSIAYDGNATLTYSISGTSVTNTTQKFNAHWPDIFANSTKSALGSPTYIDLDIGEAYYINGGSAVSVNNAVSIPAELPTLPSGATTITFDNTFTKVDIVPRWWKV